MVVSRRFQGYINELFLLLIILLVLSNIIFLFCQKRTATLISVICLVRTAPDHFVLSGSLLSEGSASYVEGVKVFRADWLLKPDDRYTGQYPKRTYSGPRYLGGYSDHLPIYFDLKRSNL